METITGTITAVEVKRYTPFVPDYYRGQNVEEYDVRLLVTVQQDNGAITRFRSPAANFRITTVPGVAVATCEETVWITSKPANDPKWAGGFPASKLEVGQRITVAHRTNAKGFFTHVKLLEVA